MTQRLRNIGFDQQDAVSSTGPTATGRGSKPAGSYGSWLQVAGFPSVLN
jgi:hypothetical protein